MIHFYHDFITLPFLEGFQQGVPVEATRRSRFSGLMPEASLPDGSQAHAFLPACGGRSTKACPV